MSDRLTAAKLVREVIPRGHPSSVVEKLCKEAALLLEDGMDVSLVKEALRLWLAAPSAAASWLPRFASDVVKQGGSGERDYMFRQAWKTGDTKPLAKFGLVFTPPDLPREITTVPEAKAFMKAAKRAWIEQVRKEL